MIAAIVFCAHLGVLLIFGMEALLGFTAGILFTLILLVRALKSRYEEVMKNER